MQLSKRIRERMLAHCGQIQEDDGIDPRELSKSQYSRECRGRRTDQLCRQVAKTLELLLAGEFADDLLRNLQVVSVAPAPDTSRLAVTVIVDVADGASRVREVADRLARVTGRLRCEVAAAITRKRAPKLKFRVFDRSFRPLTG